MLTAVLKKENRIMKWQYSVPYAILGLALAILAVIIKRYAMLDVIANLSFPYLCSLIGLAVVLLGVHCLVFDSPPARLKLLPNLILFLIFAVASIVDVIWDGILNSFPTGEIVENAVGNSVEFVVIYAAVLFLPRFKGRHGDTDETIVA